MVLEQDVRDRRRSAHGRVAHRQHALRLAQGVTAAASGGTLIYAACIELLAGDFVQDASLKRAPIMRQALALGSLLAGLAAMATLA